MHAYIIHYGSKASPGAYACMLTLFFMAAQQLQERVLFAEVGFHICCRFAQGGDLEGWLAKARDSAGMSRRPGAQECITYTPPQQAQVKGMIRDLYQVCTATSPM